MRQGTVSPASCIHSLRNFSKTNRHTRAVLAHGEAKTSEKYLHRRGDLQKFQQQVQLLASVAARFLQLAAIVSHFTAGAKSSYTIQGASLANTSPAGIE
jgi:hypothetical protein